MAQIPSRLFEIVQQLKGNEKPKRVKFAKSLDGLPRQDVDLRSSRRFRKYFNSLVLILNPLSLRQVLMTMSVLFFVPQ